MSRKVLKLKKLTSSLHRIEVKSSGMKIGNAVRDVDGFFYYSRSDGSGLFASYELREIADKLDKLNKKWNKKIDKYFKKKPH